MTRENNFIYDVDKLDRDGYSDFQFISSWATNYRSWKVQKKIPIKIIKYEDLLNQTYVVFMEVVKFINQITNNKEFYHVFFSIAPIPISCRYFLLVCSKWYSLQSIIIQLVC